MTWAHWPLPKPDQASSIAVEHVLFRTECGLTPWAIIEETGIRWTSLRDPTIDDAVLAVCVAWRRTAA
ncbi:MAG: hypothetical protein QOJ54_1418 [Aliidongia sp.]|nr:hypothetical protein [Aliidongia sp.]